MIKYKNYLLFLLMLVIFGINIVTAANYYVATNGDNSDPGNLAQPWKTIQKAANTAQAGDTVYVRAGKYNEQVIIQNSGNSSSGFITFRNYNNDYVIIDGTGVTMDYSWHGLIHIDGKSYIRIQGFHIRNVPHTDYYASLLVQTWAGPSSHIEILDNEISLHTNHVVALFANGSLYALKDVLIDNNEVHHCHTYSMEAIRVGGYATNFKVSRNHVHHNWNIGIDVVGRTTQGIPAYGVIRSNICYNNNQMGGWSSGAGIYSDGGNHITIENNIVSNGFIGILIGGEEPNPVSIISHSNIVRNNLCYGNYVNMAIGGMVQANPTIVKHSIVRNNIFTKSIWTEMRIFSAESNLVENNIIYSSYPWTLVETNWDHANIPLNKYSYNCYPVGTSSYVQSFPGTNNIFADPLFVNYANRDFHLTGTSPCIDRGDPATVIGIDETDMDGQNRIYNIIDIGAYEYYSQITSPIWISATPVSTNQINLLWRDLSNETSYTLFRNTINNSTGAIKVTGTSANITNYNNSGLVPETKYYYWLKAYNASGSSPYSSVISNTTYPRRPSSPQWITATPVATNQINLLWHNLSNETSYTLFRNTVKNTNTANKITGTSANITNYNNTGLQKATQYFYWLKAYNISGSSLYSSVISNSTYSNSPSSPSQPLWISATPMATNQINLLWRDLPNETSYTLFKNTTDTTNGAQKINGTLANITNYSDVTLSQDTTYFYWLKAYNNFNSSLYSLSISATTFPRPPTAPSWIEAKAVSTNQINLLWKNLPTETGYHLYRNNNNNSGTAVKIKELSVNITNYSDVGLIPNSTYFYWLKAYNLGGYSGFSSVISNKTPVPDKINFDRSKIRVLPNYIGPHDYNEVTIYLGGLDKPEKKYKVMMISVAGHVIKNLGDITYDHLNQGIKYQLINSEDKKVNTGVYIVLIVGKNERFIKKLYVAR